MFSVETEPQKERLIMSELTVQGAWNLVSIFEREGEKLHEAEDGWNKGVASILKQLFGAAEKKQPLSVIIDIAPDHSIPSNRQVFFDQLPGPNQQLFMLICMAVEVLSGKTMKFVLSIDPESRLSVLPNE